MAALYRCGGKKGSMKVRFQSEFARKETYSSRVSPVIFLPFPKDSLYPVQPPRRGISRKNTDKCSFQLVSINLIDCASQSFFFFFAFSLIFRIDARLIDERSDYITCLRERNNFFQLAKITLRIENSSIHSIYISLYSGQVFFFFFFFKYSGIHLHTLSLRVRPFWISLHFSFYNCFFTYRKNRYHQGPFSRFFVKRN